MAYETPYHRRNKNGEAPQFDLTAEQWHNSEHLFRVDHFEESALLLCVYWINMYYQMTLDEKYDPDKLLPPLEEAIMLCGQNI